MINSITNKFNNFKAIMNYLISPTIKDLITVVTPVTLWVWDVLPTGLTVICGFLSVWHLYNKGKIASIDRKLKEKDLKDDSK